MSRKRAVFLDRDDTICEDKVYNSVPDKVKLLPGVTKGLRMLSRAGYLLIVVTNQSGIGRGYFKEEELEAVHQRMRELLQEEGAKIDALYYCPHHPDDGCDCRKPKPGMILRAVEDFGLDLKKCYIIGDKPADVECGKNLGIPSILVSKEGGKPDGGVFPDYIARDLSEAAEWIVSKG